MQLRLMLACRVQRRPADAGVADVEREKQLLHIFILLNVARRFRLLTESRAKFEVQIGSWVYRLAVRHADTTGIKSTLFNIKPTRTLVGLFVFDLIHTKSAMLGISPEFHKTKTGPCRRKMKRAALFSFHPARDLL